MNEEINKGLPEALTFTPEIPEDIEEKLKPFEGLTIEGIRGNARLEDEDFEDYRLRREIEKQYVKNYLKGKPIVTSPSPTRAQKRLIWKEYKKKGRYERMEEQKYWMEPRMCPRCRKMFPRYEFIEHFKTHKKKD